MVFEVVPQSGQGGGIAQRTIRPERLAHRRHIFGGVWEIEDAHRVGRVQVDKLLTPLGAIDHRAHAARRFTPASMQFHERLVGKGGAV